jgi:hypothetical protein
LSTRTSRRARPAGSLQAEEGPLDEEIAGEIIELTPESWRSAVLEVAYEVEAGIDRYSHVITSPEGHLEPIVPSEKLFDATHRLGLLFRKHGRHWRRAFYRVDIREDGTSTYVATFEY